MAGRFSGGKQPANPLLSKSAKEVRLSDLRPAQRRLVQLLREVGHGRIEGLIIQGGEPVFTPAPRIIREIKLDLLSASQALEGAGDFALKGQVRNLLNHLAAMGNGRLETLFVADGLPVRMSVEGHGS